MTERNDGGPAFPVNPDVAGHEALRGSAMGMSLRDYFAAKAMQGLLDLTAKGVNLTDEDLPNATTGEIVAEQAYYLADCMIRKRINHE